jgi:hypothetical protein
MMGGRGERGVEVGENEGGYGRKDLHHRKTEP